MPQAVLRDDDSNGNDAASRPTIRQLELAVTPQFVL
jgi:hypothetical protein